MTFHCIGDILSTRKFFEFPLFRRPLHVELTTNHHLAEFDMRQEASSPVRLFEDSERMATILLPAMDGKFVVREHFVENKMKDAPVRIARLGGEFTRHFLDKVEEPIGQTVLSYSALLTPAIDADVVATLGGKSQVQAFLRQLFYLLREQPEGHKDRTGQNDTLQVSNALKGAAGNIIYALDANGELRHVAATWTSDGWVIGSLDFATVSTKWNKWEFGNQFFFPRPHPLSVYA